MFLLLTSIFLLPVTVLLRRLPEHLRSREPNAFDRERSLNAHGIIIVFYHRFVFPQEVISLLSLFRDNVTCNCSKKLDRITLFFVKKDEEPLPF